MPLVRRALRYCEYTASITRISHVQIFYMEACVFDAVCSNRESLWQLNVGEDWVCDLEFDGYQQFRDWVLYPGSG